jgi:hypothetical protein
VTIDFLLERALSRGLKQVQRFRGDRDFIDLHDFLHFLKLEYNTSNELADRIETLRAALERTGNGQTIIANVAGSNIPKAHGLSIYFPDQGCSKYYEDVEISAMGWKDLIYKQNRLTSL